MKFLNKIFGREDAVTIDARRIYSALFDEMKDDFEIALREEALSDASVKKQIQPMISLFYDRVKKYAEGLNQTNVRESIQTIFSENLQSEGDESKSEFVNRVSDYLIEFDKGLSSLSLGQIAMTEFSFPELSV